MNLITLRGLSMGLARDSSGRRPSVNRFPAIVAGLGQEEMPTDIVTIMQEFYRSYRGVAPTVEFLGSHPMLTITMLLGAIIAGGAIGGYIGAGMRE